MNIGLFLFVLLFVYNAASDDYDSKVDEEDKARRRILDQLTKTHTVLADGYHLVTRQTATDVYMYRGYRSVGVIFYPIMRDVVDARFTFQAEELHFNSIGSCKAEHVIIKLKHGSYPAVNPDGYAFPKDFIDPAKRDTIYTVEFLSDGQSNIFSVENPKPGNWYAIAYIKWEDPKTESIDQQGLVALCQTILYSDLQVKKQEDVELIDCYSELSLNYNEIGHPSIFKCMSLDIVDPVSLNITVNNGESTSLQKVAVKIEALSIPTQTNYLVSCAFDPSSEKAQVITFYPHPNSWHYITIETIPENYTKIADCESYRRVGEEEENVYALDDLMRDSKGRFFTFDYGIPTTDLHEATSLVNLTSNAVSSVRFKLNQFLDIGGTLTIEASLLMSLKYYMGYKREKKGNLLAYTDENQFFRVVICMDIGHASLPLPDGQCKYNDVVKPALFILNSTDSDTIYEKTMIPYPESGDWYLSMRIFCDEVVCPCNTSDNGTKYYATEGLVSGGNSSEGANATRMGETECNATVVLSLSSSSCVSGRCSNHGNCMLNTLGGLVVSFCHCSSGYGGWDCSDDSRMDSQTDMILSVMLLTLSNILFFFSIYVAIIRLYYTEAAMYILTMIFSTFYHACDAPPQIHYCIIKGNLLQYGDFNCGLMCFWLTLLAMSLISDRTRANLQLFGAIFIALLTFWSLHSIFTFFAPVSVGIAVVLLSWFIDYRRTREFSLPRSYYRRHFPIGLGLVSFGLICYAFLQTEQNYKIVHSGWHMLIALSVGFLLPDVRRGNEGNAFLPNAQNKIALPICIYPFRRGAGSTQ